MKLIEFNVPNNLRKGMRNGVIDLLGYVERQNKCSICSEKILNDEKLIQLGCNHTYHKFCFKTL